MKHSEKWSGMFIPDQDFSPIPDPGVKKTPNPGFWIRNTVCNVTHKLLRVKAERKKETFLLRTLLQHMLVGA